MVYLLSFLFATGCVNDGPNFQIVYAAPGDNRVADVSTLLRALVLTVNDAFGGSRTLRLDCSPIRSMQVPERADFQKIDQTRQQTGYTNRLRKYIIFVDAPANKTNCGEASIAADTRHGPDNANNWGYGLAVLWSDCWLPGVVRHEVGHLLGAVQPSAPYGTSDFHCRTTGDVMCGTYFSAYDLSRDTYYNPNPAKGSYLDTHWNIANSRFLDVTVPKVYTLFIP